MSGITQQEKVKKLLNEGIRSHVISGIIKKQGNLYEWLQCAPIVFREYLKLHEENQRLQQEIFLLKSWQEKFTDSRYDSECVADNLRDKVERLENIVDKQRDALKEIRDTLKVYTSRIDPPCCILMAEVAQEALEIAVIDKEHPIMEELKIEIEIIKKVWEELKETK